ncbi:MAG TPA: hypothetical protein VKB95_01140 [Chitinophagaceae bacterium]|nr:hypothetical protein [Chitinophagaceae bacterium]
MKKINFLFLSAALFSINLVQAQTVDEIISKHVEAVGGKEKLSQAKSIYIENSMEVMGSQAPSTEYILEGKGYKSESEFNGAKIVNCYTDKGGWTLNPMTGAADPQAMPVDVYKAGKDQIFIEGPLVDYAAKGNKVELLGKEENNYKIKVNDGTTYYIDANTYYVTKTTTKGEMMGQPVEVVVTFSDYKKTDFGLLYPYAKTVDLGGFTLGFKRNKVEINKEIDPKVFEMSK